jgi:adenylate kinase
MVQETVGFDAPWSLALQNGFVNYRHLQPVHFRNSLADFSNSIWQSSRPSMFCLYFIGGMFAAGKSTLCQALSGLLPAEHLKASELIGYAPNPKDATGKATDQVLSNQDSLIAALDHRRAAPATVLLDGHFCLLDTTYNVVRLSVNVFQRIQPSALVLVESTPSEIFYRIKQRGGKEMDPALIRTMLKAEREHGKDISDALGVPIMTADGSTAAGDILAFLRSCSPAS